MHLNTIEFLWDPVKNASVFIQVHTVSGLGGVANTFTANIGVLKPLFSSQVNCISTEFTPRKHGGEKGVPFRIQVDTFTSNEHGEYLEHVHSSSCQVKVFKVGKRSYLYVYLYKCIFDTYI